MYEVHTCIVKMNDSFHAIKNFCRQDLPGPDPPIVDILLIVLC